MTGFEILLFTMGVEAALGFLGQFTGNLYEVGS